MMSFDRVIRWIETTLSISSLMAIVVLVIVQIFYRYVLSGGILWINEVVTNLMVLLVMAGSALAARHGEHTQMTMLAESLPKWFSRFFSALSLLVTLGFLVTLIVASGIYAWQSKTLHSTMLEFPMLILYGILPVGGALIFYEFVRAALIRFNQQRGARS